MDLVSADLMARWRDGDQHAADELFHRYAERLYALARNHLSTRLSRHLDPEDVVQSAYRSFFTGARDGRYALARSGDLWRLLAAITLHKLRRRVEHFTAGKRSVIRECDPGSPGGHPDALAREPTPEEAAALADTVEQVLRGLEPLECRMVELRLHGHALEEIAAEVRRSERTVRRVLDRVRQRLRLECGEEPRV